MKISLVNMARNTCSLIAVALLAGACASLMGPRTVELPLSVLQEAFARKFPFDNRYLELFDIQVTNPKLALQEDTNRVVTTMDASIGSLLGQQPWKGSFTLSGLLKVDAARNAVVLAEPRVENVASAGPSGPYTTQITRIGSLLAEQLLQDMPIYTFDPADFQHGGTRFSPTKINTSANGLVVTFAPVR
jgi:hypothetical protein